jgi:hypothetical protein
MSRVKLTVRSQLEAMPSDESEIHDKLLKLKKFHHSRHTSFWSQAYDIYVFRFRYLLNNSHNIINENVSLQDY